MKIWVKVRPGAGREAVEDLGVGEGGTPEYKVWVRETPERGAANKAVIRALAEYFKVAKSRVSILSGHTSSQKVIKID